LLKADKPEVETLKEKINNLENHSKRKNVVIWGIPESSENDFSLMEEFIESEIFQSHMNFEWRIEVMRAHRTGIKRNPSENDTCTSLANRQSPSS